LLTGPCGTGKTATLKVICNDFGVEVLEYESNRAYELSLDSEEVWDESEIKVFQRFLYEAEYPSVECSAKRRLVLVEHLPNRFYRLVL
jgi:broad-specificity NMP kinase